jgi:hypothetical protein
MALPLSELGVGPDAGLEPALFIITSDVPYQLGVSGIKFG